jgi:hypothetical protein
MIGKVFGVIVFSRIAYRLGGQDEVIQLIGSTVASGLSHQVSQRHEVISFVQVKAERSIARKLVGMALF